MQVTLPLRVMRAVGLKVGDPIEFEPLPDGGVGLYRYGHHDRRTTVWDLAVAVSTQVPGVADIELETPPTDVEAREVLW